MSVNHRTVDFIAPVMVRDGVSMFPCRQREEFHGLRPDKQKPRGNAAGLPLRGFRALHRIAPWSVSAAAA